MNISWVVGARLDEPYIHLSQGVTYYVLEGSPSSPVVVFIHDGITPLVTWDEYVPPLVTSGYRVLRYDAYGRGHSGRPDTIYNRALYRQQLLDLLNRLNITEPVDLEGKETSPCPFPLKLMLKDTVWLPLP